MSRPVSRPVFQAECPDLAFAEALLGTPVWTPWQRAFVVGCRRSSDAGRPLTPKQYGVLHRLRDIASDSEVQA